MRGLDPLLALRRAGWAPHHVNVETDAVRLPRHWCEASLRAGVVELQVDPTEALHRLDLRCLSDLIVAVSGTDAERVQAVAEACTAAGAVRVIATTHRADRDALGVNCIPVQVTDTAGILAWHA